MKPIIWVARPDKTGWNATRARDRVDYSFCVYRETDVFPARLVVRDTYTDKPGARARKVVGEFTFPNAKMAKKLVVETLDLLNDEMLYPSASYNRVMLRDRFMAAMMKHSVAESDTKYYSTCIWYYDLFTNDFVRPVANVYSASASAVVPPATSMPEPMSDTEPWESLTNDVNQAMQMLEQVEQMVEPVFDPESWSPGDAVPAGWAIIGGKPVQFSWPK